MDVKKEFATNVKEELDGKWVDMGDGCKMLIARIGNKKYNKLFRKLTKPYKRAIRADRLPDDVADEIMIKTMAYTILLDWEGLEEDEKIVAYSEKEAIRILTTYKDLRDQISDIAGEMESFRLEDDEDGQGNLEAS